MEAEGANEAEAAAGAGAAAGADYWVGRVESIRRFTRRDKDARAPYKPLLLLWLIGRVVDGQPAEVAFQRGRVGPEAADAPAAMISSALERSAAVSRSSPFCAGLERRGIAIEGHQVVGRYVVFGFCEVGHRFRVAERGQGSSGRTRSLVRRSR